MRVLPDGTYEAIQAGPCDVETGRPGVTTIHWPAGNASFSSADVTGFVENGDLLFPAFPSGPCR